MIRCSVLKVLLLLLVTYGLTNSLDMWTGSASKAITNDGGLQKIVFMRMLYSVENEVLQYLSQQGCPFAHITGCSLKFKFPSYKLFT